MQYESSCAGVVGGRGSLSNGRRRIENEGCAGAKVSDIYSGCYGWRAGENTRPVLFINGLTVGNVGHCLRSTIARLVWSSVGRKYSSRRYLTSPGLGKV